MSVAAPDLVHPSFFWAPPDGDQTLGDAAIELAASAGLFLDPWQQLAIRTILAEAADGAPVAFEATLVVPRQNGKGSVLEALALAWLFLTDADLILWSAHEFKTAAEGFRRLRTLILGAPHLAKRVAENGIRTAAGNESIELVTGQRIKFIARSKGSGRGFPATKVILDEAYELADEETDALIPTLSTKHEGQVVYTSSAGMATSHKLRSLRDRGRKGGDTSLCYLEWGGTATCATTCGHELENKTCALNDRGLWRDANPSIDIRIFTSFIEKERRALSPAGFSRERLGIWDEPHGESPIPVALWSACRDANSSISSAPIIAIDVTPGLGAAAVAAAGWRADGLPHVEVIRHDPGVEWVHEFVVGVVKRQNPAAVALFGSAPVRALVPDLEAAGVKVMVIGDGESAAACAALQADVLHERLRHFGDPLLVAALSGAARRDVGDGGWTWRRKTSTADISPLVAVTAARWGLSVVPPVPDYDPLKSFNFVPRRP